MVLFGATAMPGAATETTIRELPGVKYMRDFGEDHGARLPRHHAGKWLVRPPKCLQHVSWKGDLGQLTAWLDAAGEDFWLTWWHENHGDAGQSPALYRRTAEQMVEIVRAHPRGKLVRHNMPIVTKFWLVNKGGDPREYWYEGATAYGIDVYLDDSDRYTTPEHLIGRALDRVRDRLPGVPIAIPEFGIELKGDDSGPGRAAFMADCAAYLREQPDVIACAWWDIGGNRISEPVGRPEADVWRAVLAAQDQEEEPVGWKLNRALTTMRAEVDARYPRRDKTSDGTIGDRAHQATASDHNPDSDGSVDAWDMDVDLRSGDDKAAIEWLKGRFEVHPSALYWIHNRQIASRDWGWQRRRYDGANPHDKHVHWNTRASHEDSTAPWGIAQEEDDMADPKTIQAIAEAVAKRVAALDIPKASGRAVHNQQLFRHTLGDGSPLTIGHVLSALRPVPGALEAVRAAVGGDLVDEAAIASAVLAGLSPEQIASAIPEGLAAQLVDELGRRLAGAAAAEGRAGE